MGFDLNGLKPNTDVMTKDWEGNDVPVGEYFRNNIWWWRKLWSIVMWSGHRQIDLADKYNHMPLNKREKMLDEWHEKFINGGMNDGERIDGKWLTLMEESIEWLLENKEHKDVKSFMKDMNEHAKDENGEDHYQFSWENVEEFQAFVVNSGGFEIW